MTAAAAAVAPRRTETTSLWIVVALVVVGILASLGLRSTVEGGTTPVSKGGVSAAIPQAWRLDDGVGEVAFIASNIERPAERYIAQIRSAKGTTVSTLANQEGAGKAAFLPGYTEISRTEVVVNGTTGLAVDYAYLAPATGGDRPTMILGEQIFLPSGDAFLDLTYEAPASDWDAGLAQFHRFAGSARVGA